MNDFELDSLLRAIPDRGPKTAHVSPGDLDALRLGSSPDPGPIEAHLAECRECRSRLLALSDPDKAALERPARRFVRPPARWRMGGAAGLAAAAGLFFVLLRPTPSVPEGYALDPLEGGIERVRGQSAKPAELPTYGPGSTVTLRLRPEDPVGEGMIPSVTLFAEPPLRRLDPVVRTTGSGVIELRIDAASAFFEPGQNTFVVVLHPRGSVVERDAIPQPSSSARIFTAELRYADPGAP